MKALIPLLGVGAACAACCAIPLALPLVGGLAVSGAIGAVAGWQLALGATALMAALASGWHLLRRRRACSIDRMPARLTGCGCAATSPSKSTSDGGAQ